MPEQDFWQTMNPARLHALFAAHFGKPAREAPSGSSLIDYLRGG